MSVIIFKKIFLSSLFRVCMCWCCSLSSLSLNILHMHTLYILQRGDNILGVFQNIEGMEMMK